ncbi:MAG: cupredoxin domain-containing protein [Myxococcota bacterium]|nr:cupredoxin domain-containing protein [Myxococcota bacterium]
MNGERSQAALAFRRRRRLFVLGSFVGLAACSRHADAEPDTAPSVAGSLTGESRVTAGEHGFSPSSIVLPKGASGSTHPVIFVRTSEKTCATEVAFPDLGVQKALPLNTAVSIDVPTGAPRTLSFQCGMGMYKGALVVR